MGALSSLTNGLDVGQRGVQRRRATKSVMDPQTHPEERALRRHRRRRFVHCKPRYVSHPRPTPFRRIAANAGRLRCLLKAEMAVL
jgi:hypothetical protein